MTKTEEPILTADAEEDQSPTVTMESDLTLSSRKDRFEDDALQIARTLFEKGKSLRAKKSEDFPLVSEDDLMSFNESGAKDDFVDLLDLNCDEGPVTTSIATPSPAKAPGREYSPPERPPAGAETAYSKHKRLQRILEDVTDAIWKAEEIGDKLEVRLFFVCSETEPVDGVLETLKSAMSEGPSIMMATKGEPPPDQC